jgi:predicted TIM-barrel fold metal-dependent hydrolase
MSPTITDSTLAGHPSSAKLKDILVVDVDVHVNETPQAIAAYCEMPWRKSLEALREVPQGYLNIPGYAQAQAPWPIFPDSSGRRRKTVTSAREMRKDLDDLGVDIGVLFPDFFLFHAALQQSDYAIALAKAYNRWLAEEWLGEDNGLKGAVMAPHHDPVVAAAEIRRYAKHKHIKAIYLPTAMVDPFYGHRRYDPVYEAAQETNLPLFFHSVTCIHPTFPFNMHGFSTLFSAHVMAHPFSCIANLLSMLETGVPVRFPHLRIAFTEAGIGWVPWLMMRIDKEYNERRRDLPFYKDRPSECIRKMFFSTQPIEEPANLRELAALISLFDGENSVIFSSDWPHHDFDHPSKVLQIPLSEEGKRKILGTNALRLLNLEVAKR